MADGARTDNGQLVAVLVPERGGERGAQKIFRGRAALVRRKPSRSSSRGDGDGDGNSWVDVDSQEVHESLHASLWYNMEDNCIDLVALHGVTLVDAKQLSIGQVGKVKVGSATKLTFGDALFDIQTPPNYSRGKTLKYKRISQSTMPDSDTSDGSDDEESDYVMRENQKKHGSVAAEGGFPKFETFLSKSKAKMQGLSREVLLTCVCFLSLDEEEKRELKERDTESLCGRLAELSAAEAFQRANFSSSSETQACDAAEKTRVDASRKVESNVSSRPSTRGSVKTPPQVRESRRIAGKRKLEVDKVEAAQRQAPRKSSRVAKVSRVDKKATAVGMPKASKKDLRKAAKVRELSETNEKEVAKQQTPRKIALRKRARKETKSSQKEMPQASKIVLTGFQGKQEEKKAMSLIKNIGATLIGDGESGEKVCQANFIVVNTTNKAPRRTAKLLAALAMPGSHPKAPQIVDFQWLVESGEAGVPIVPSKKSHVPKTLATALSRRKAAKVGLLNRKHIWASSAVSNSVNKLAVAFQNAGATLHTSASDKNAASIHIISKSESESGCRGDKVQRRRLDWFLDGLMAYKINF